MNIYQCKKILHGCVIVIICTFPLPIQTHKERDSLLFQNTQSSVICNCTLCKELNAEHDYEIPSCTKSGIKDWTIIVYMAADNDLRNFAVRNIKQMELVGSGVNCNILVHLDIRISGNKKITRRYYIEKNRIIHVNANDPATQQMDSGDPQTLISCCKWSISYPSRNKALIFWNHGTGAVDPERGRVLNPAELFAFNPLTNKFDLDRSVAFLDLIEPDLRGICWDDTTGNYLTNQKLHTALQNICTNLLQGEKFNIIGFDACLMSMIEVANIIKYYADIMIGSQEVELGAGWDYTQFLAPLEQHHLSPDELAQHIVATYGKTYSSLTNDYTLSALFMEEIELLERNINTVAQLLLDCLKVQKNDTVKNAIRASRSKLACTHFDEPSYIDLHHLYFNLQKNINSMSLTNPEKNNALLTFLKEELAYGQELVAAIVFANTTGKNLANAQGISIYCPERRIHPSYRNLPFAKQNVWISLITQYLLP
ncbi:MAG TPA: clostripain-related cysteine peptidase [Candidatus Bathyarchaeia archaeon]|nr:clostripain-related cysteine peptidase [Candidatus Bathyarchaeia archaeon]